MDNGFHGYVTNYQRVSHCSPYSYGSWDDNFMSTGSTGAFVVEDWESANNNNKWNGSFMIPEYPQLAGQIPFKWFNHQFPSHHVFLAFLVAHKHDKNIINPRSSPPILPSLAHFQAMFQHQPAAILTTTTTATGHFQHLPPASGPPQGWHQGAAGHGVRAQGPAMETGESNGEKWCARCPKRPGGTGQNGVNCR